MHLYIIALLVIYWLFCAILYPSLPPQVPIHWNIYGTADRFGPSWLVFLSPLLPLAVYYAMLMTRRLDPKRNYGKFEHAYKIITIAITLFLTGASMRPLISGLGIAADMGLVSRAALPLLFITIGSYMKRLHCNHFIGIKTPWTLASEEIWNKTHRFAGKAMAAGATISLLGLLFEPVLGSIILLAGILLPLLAAVLYSYLLYQQNGQ